LKGLKITIPYILLVCGIFYFLPARTQTKNSPYIKFKDSNYNFGFVRQGRVIKIEYYFENTGKDPLIISNIEVSCGCTIADFPHHPIKHGESGMILITFDTKEKYDRQDRIVEVISNASNSPTKLRFKGVVLESRKSEKQ